jgi:hypothetical protein
VALRLVALAAGAASPPGPLLALERQRESERLRLVSSTR